MLRISPAGEFLLQRCKRNQKTAGGGSRAFNNALSRLPRTPCFFYGGATKGRGYIHPAREKTRIPLLAPPAAAPCSLNKDFLLQELSRLDFCPRAAVRWSVRLRGWCLGQGSGCSTPGLLVCSGPSARWTSTPIPALDLPGHRPPGGTSNRGDRSPPCVGRFKEGGFQRGEGNRNPSHL